MSKMWGWALILGAWKMLPEVMGFAVQAINSIESEYLAIGPVYRPEIMTLPGWLTVLLIAAFLIIDLVDSLIRIKKEMEGSSWPFK